MSQFEFRCPIHGHVFDVIMDIYEIARTCPVVVEDVRCATTLFVAEKGTYPDA